MFYVVFEETSMIAFLAIVQGFGTCLYGNIISVIFIYQNLRFINFRKKLMSMKVHSLAKEV